MPLKGGGNDVSLSLRQEMEAKEEEGAIQGKKQKERHRQPYHEESRERKKQASKQYHVMKRDKRG